MCATCCNDLFVRFAWIRMHLLVLCVAALAPREGQPSIVTMVEMICLQGNDESVKVFGRSI